MRPPHPTLRARIRLGDLRYVEASGASDISCRGAFESAGTTIRLSGSSDLDGLELSCTGSVDIGCSGSSDMDDATIRHKEMKITLSGSSDAEILAYGGLLSCELSGASDLKIAGEADDATVRVSGSSDLSASGLRQGRYRTDGTRKRGFENRLSGKSLFGSIALHFFRLVGPKCSGIDPTVSARPYRKNILPPFLSNVFYKSEPAAGTTPRFPEEPAEDRSVRPPENRSPHTLPHIRRGEKHRKESLLPPKGERDRTVRSSEENPEVRSRRPIRSLQRDSG